jgi:deazaflavin-dependent oxidoreductase (nitroreductase family)
MGYQQDHAPVRRPRAGLRDHQPIGRKSGKTYETPINVFRTATGYRVALTYGAKAEWVKNVLASGECTLRVRGRRVACRNPRLGTDPANLWAPWLVRQIIGRAGVTEYLDLTA